jgi:hypothetical protein
MKRELAAASALVLWLFAASATAALSQQEAAVTPSSIAEVIRDGDNWTVDFAFDREEAAWLFTHSAVGQRTGRPWRPGSWTVETPGVHIERVGRHDLLIAERGNVPRRVRVRFRPASIDLVAEYEPALIFSDGSVALWSGHFELAPIGSAEAAEALPLDLNGIGLGGDGARVDFRDRNGRVLHAGRRVDEASLTGNPSYILFGPLDEEGTDDFAAVIDPALPLWLKRELTASTPVTFRALTKVLGPHGGPTPTLLVSWRGPTAGMMSMGGGALPTQIVMSFEGVGVIEPNESLSDNARWFIAHEASHFWLGNAVGYEFARDAWITEGGADLLALRIMADPADGRTRLQQAVNDCVELADQPIESAGERGENRAYYACGAVFGLVAEAASGQPFPLLMRALIDANREDSILSRAEWLAALDRTAGNRVLSRRIARLLDRGSDRPEAAIADLFERSGVRFERSEDGIPRLL